MKIIFHGIYAHGKKKEKKEKIIFNMVLTINVRYRRRNTDIRPMKNLFQER